MLDGCTHTLLPSDGQSAASRYQPLNTDHMSSLLYTVMLVRLPQGSTLLCPVTVAVKGGEWPHFGPLSLELRNSIADRVVT
jgi:hypothetical protein